MGASFFLPSPEIDIFMGCMVQYSSCNGSATKKFNSAELPQQGPFVDSIQSTRAEDAKKASEHCEEVVESVFQDTREDERGYGSEMCRDENKIWLHHP